MKIVKATLLAAVLSWTALLPPGAVAQVAMDPDLYCARVGEKAIQCGATNPSRPQKCCGGLQCAPGNVQKHCVEPSALPPPPMCAKENERAINCGALWAPDRAQNCCHPFICHPGNAKVTCTDPANVNVQSCALTDEKAVECGADVRIGRPQKCCEGYTCEPGNVKKTCIEKGLVDIRDITPCALEGERAQQCGASSRNKGECCEGFVCTPGNVKRTCTAKENIPPPPTCAAEGNRALDCGAPALADGSRPKECCGGLICAPGNVKKICVSIGTVDPSVLSDCAADGERAIECGALAAPGRKNRCCGGYICSPDNAKVICVSEGSVDPIDILKESQTCALEGERALDCGAAPARGRHQSCCNGYSCEPGNVKVACTSNSNLPTAPKCGTEGVKATSCGATPSADRPEGCCDGFVCHPGPQKVFCTDATNVTIPQTTADGSVCAGDGERAQGCGAKSPSRPASCCPGYMCEFGAGVRCVVDPFAPTATPTLKPTKYPTKQPTPRPTSPPTRMPTPFPTTAAPTEPQVFGKTCATAGQRSQMCGAAAVGGGGNSRPLNCCPGFKCDSRYPGRCMVNPNWLQPTLKPTKAPTKTTPMPTKRPTKAPTEKPTVTPGNPTASPTAALIPEPSFSHAIFTSLAISNDVPEEGYAEIGETLLGVTNEIITRKVGFDVRMKEETEDDGSGRRLVVLEHDSTSLSLVPMNIPDQRQEDVGFAWVAYRMSYVVKQFDGLGKNEIKEMIDEEWTKSIDDGSLQWELQGKNPNILGVSVFGEETKSDVRDVVDPPTDPPTTSVEEDETDALIIGTREEGGGGGGGASTTPWWVWLLVGLVGLAIVVAIAFFVLAKRKSKKVRREASKRGELLKQGDEEDHDMPTKVPAAPTFEESSDEGHKDNQPNEAFAKDQTFDTTFPSFEVPEDEKGKGSQAKSKGCDWGDDGFSMDDLAKQPGW